MHPDPLLIVALLLDVAVFVALIYVTRRGR